MDWVSVEEAYLGNAPIELTYVDNFFSPKALAALLDMARGSTIFFENRCCRVSLTSLGGGQEGSFADWSRGSSNTVSVPRHSFVFKI